MPMITCEKVTLSYGGSTVASDVSFCVEKGDYLFIVGENGSGKTTLMKALLGLIKPQSGHITYDGLEPTEIGYLPQQTQVQRDFPASVFEAVISGTQNRGGFRLFYSKEDKKRAAECIRTLGLGGLEKKCYHELSGGQQQRVLLARALCAAEKLLILDEPAAGLDPKATNEMYETVRQLNRDRGITVIMVSHDIPSAVRYASRILHMHSTPLFFGTAKDYAASDISKIFLGGERK